VDIWNGTDRAQAASGTTIGYSRILPLSTPVTTDRIRIRVRVLSGRATPRLATVGLYRSTPPTS
jgi:alpha-L-fucosidase